MTAGQELPHEALLWQPRPRSYLVTVACKATFALEPGELALAPAQEPIALEDSFFGGDPSRSLVGASDVVPSKPKCDVIVTGHVYANDDRGAQQVVARLCLAPIDKRIDVVGDRAVGADGTVYQGPRFQRIPILYERASGGPGTWNPVGVRATSRDAYGRAPLPNLVPHGKGADASTLPDPIGFGPICATWQLRADKLGFHSFGPTGWAGEPIPEGFDLGYFNVAPADQQLDQIPEDASIVLEHLHPKHARLTCKLPGIRPRVTVERRGGPERPMMRPDTLWIDTERCLVLVTWRGHFALEHEAETYRIRADVEQPRESWRTVEHALPQNALSQNRRVERTSLDAFADQPRSVEPVSSAAASRLPARTMLDTKKLGGPALPFGASAPDPRTGALPFASPAVTRALPAMTPASLGLPFAGGSPFSPPAAPPAPSAPPPAPVSSQALPPVPAPPVPAPPMAQPAAVPPIAMPSTRPPLPTSPIGSPPSADPWVRSRPVQQPSAVPMHGSAAALGGLVSASNAAADPRRPGEVEKPVSRFTGDVLHVVWFLPELTPRLRRKPEWKKILDRLELVRFDPDADHPDLAGDPAALEEQREIFAILSKGTAGTQDAVDTALLASLRSDGRFAPQLLLLGGEMRFDFDEMELLKATVTTARPFADADENLKKAVESATVFFSNTDAVASPEVVTAMTGRVREAFQQATSRPVPASFLDEQTERVLLEKRALQKREVFGGSYARAILAFGGTAGVPTYVPWDVAKKLPIFRRLRVRVLAEAHNQADQYESHVAALKVVALARVVR